MAVVETQKQGDVAVIRMDNPPVNALGHALRVGLEKAFAEANADAGVKAIVLTGTGRFFSAGADITEFKGEMKEPFLPQLIDTIEASAKPVVAAVNGTALGGGLELALGLPLPRRGQGRAPAGAARDQARHHSGRRRHAATAARHRRRAGPAD